MSTAGSTAVANGRGAVPAPVVSLAAVERGDGWVRLTFEHEGRMHETDFLTSWQEVFDAASAAVTSWSLLGRSLVPDCAIIPFNGGYTAKITHRRGYEQIIVEGQDLHPLVAAARAWCQLFNFLSRYRSFSPAESDAI